MLNTDLEQSGDGIGSYTPIRVCDQILEIDVASSDTSRVLQGQRRQCTCGGELECRFGRREEKLENGY